MATLDQVMQALRNADKAGDTAAATRLAQIAQSMRSPKPAHIGPQGEDLRTGPMNPPPAEMQGTPRAPENRFGDVTGDLMRGPMEAAKAYGRGMIDQSQSPTMRAMPENWNPGLRSIYARVGDTAMAGINALGAGYAGAAGLAGEIIAGDRTQEQKLASDLMMMGQVAVPELAGVSSVGRTAVSNVGRLEKAAKPTVKQQAARAADDLGITPSLGMTGRTGAMAAAGLEKVPLTGSVIARDATRAVGEVEGAFSRIVSGIGKSLNPYEAGTALQSGLKEFVTKFKDRASNLYNEVGSKIDPKRRFQLPNTAKTVGAFKQYFDENPELASRLGLNKWDGIIAELSAPPKSWGRAFVEREGMNATELFGPMREGGMSWPAIQKFRSEIGEAIGKNTGTLTDEATGRLKQLYGALTADMEAAARAAGPEAFNAWQRANNFYRSGAQRIERSLDKTITAENPERAFEAFAALTKADRSSADITRMRQIRASLPRDDWNDVAASIVDRLGKARPGAQGAAGDTFSPGAFLTEWNKLAPDAKRLLLQGDTLAELDKLAKVAEGIKAANLERNFSNTGTAVGWLATIFGTASDMGVTASALGGSYISAKGLTNVTFLRALNNAARGDAKAIKAMAGGKGPFAKDAATVLRLMAADTAMTGAANRDAAPAKAITR